MIVDSSAIIAVIRAEPGFEQFQQALTDSTANQMSAATFLEVAIVADRHADARVGAGLDALLEEASVEIVPLTVEQAQLARTAHRIFGRGSGHAARLDFGDCFAYALSKDTGQPLLFKGDDFSRTDVRNALAEA